MPHEAAPAAAAPARSSLLRSGAFSLVTSAAPLVVALLALPVLTRRLGTERLGLLALAWAWLGYATLLDFGLGRALTRMVAAADAGEVLEAPIGALVNTAHWLLTGVGAAVAIGGALLAPWYVGEVLRVSDGLRSDAVLSAIIFALTVPAVTGASVPRAVLEARQQFRSVNLIRLPVSVGTFAVPVLLLPFTASLSIIAATIAVLRAWAWWRYATLARRDLLRTEHDAADRAHLPPLLRAGAWMTVSSVLSPLMTVADRFLIGSLISVSAVALYAVPWEAITKLFIVPGALLMVLFPAANRAAFSQPADIPRLHAASLRLLLLLVTPICITVSLAAPMLLRVVGGAQYAGESVAVLRILAIGLCANCIATVPYTILQARGRARLTAMLHLVEIVPFAIVLWYGATQHGISGVAVAWTARCLLDAVLLSIFAQEVAPLSIALRALYVAAVMSVALSAWAGSLLTVSPAHASLLLLATGGAALLVWWRRPEGEREVMGRLRRRIV